MQSLAVYNNSIPNKQKIEVMVSPVHGRIDYVQNIDMCGEMASSQDTNLKSLNLENADTSCECVPTF